MTAKLILSLDGTLIQEYLLSKEHTTIGRKAHNDIVIDNLAVSSEHAAVVTILHDSFLEDLNSTNGLTVNGVSTRKHFLQNNDLIEIGKYQLRYLNDQVSKTNAADFEKTMIMRAPVLAVQPPADKPGDTGVFHTADLQAGKPAATPEVEINPVKPVLSAAAQPAPPAVQRAAIQLLNGPNAGKELELVKGLTTLGKPGVQVVVLTRRPHGFFITHVEGANFPSVNGQLMDGKPLQLNDHDLIELAGVKMEFYLKG
ncbi:MAG: FHA domain-containing protein [Gallionella sp.]|nr:FHA domain-containing protein [Gallionella sp.]